MQSNGFRDRMWVDAAGSPLTDAAKITEHFRRMDFGHHEIEITLDDPKAYIKPWTVKLDQTIKLDTENEKDVQHLVVK